MRTCIKSRMRSDFGQIGPSTTELAFKESHKLIMGIMGLARSFLIESSYKLLVSGQALKLRQDVGFHGQFIYVFFCFFFFFFFFFFFCCFFFFFFFLFFVFCFVCFFFLLFFFVCVCVCFFFFFFFFFFLFYLRWAIFALLGYLFIRRKNIAVFPLTCWKKNGR